MVPDLATALPAPTDGGRTYTFHLRKGVRYSTGAPVLAGDIRRGIERVVVHPDTAPLTTRRRSSARRPAGRPPRRPSPRTGPGRLRPEPRNRRQRPHRHDHLPPHQPHTGVRLPAGDAERLRGPAGHARRPAAGHLPAGDRAVQDPLLRPDAGSPRGLPARHGRLELVRNPHFRVWSPAAQPDGYPDRIVLDTGYTDQQAVARVENGRADMLWLGAPDRRRASSSPATVRRSTRAPGASSTTCTSTPASHRSTTSTPGAPSRTRSTGEPSPTPRLPRDRHLPAHPTQLRGATSPTARSPSAMTTTGSGTVLTSRPRRTSSRSPGPAGPRSSSSAWDDTVHRAEGERIVATLNDLGYRRDRAPVSPTLRAMDRRPAPRSWNAGLTAAGVPTTPLRRTTWRPRLLRTRLSRPRTCRDYCDRRSTSRSRRRSAQQVTDPGGPTTRGRPSTARWSTRQRSSPSAIPAERPRQPPGRQRPPTPDKWPTHRPDLGAVSLAPSRGCSLVRNSCPPTRRLTTTFLDTQESVILPPLVRVEGPRPFWRPSDMLRAGQASATPNRFAVLTARRHRSC